MQECQGLSYLPSVVEVLLCWESNSLFLMRLASQDQNHSTYDIFVDQPQQVKSSMAQENRGERQDAPNPRTT